MRAFLLREYARMVSHVKLRETHTKGMEGLIQEHGFDLVQISHHVHKPDICTPIEGKVYSITGNTPGWPKLPHVHSVKHGRTPGYVVLSDSGPRTRASADIPGASMFGCPTWGAEVATAGAG